MNFAQSLKYWSSLPNDIRKKYRDIFNKYKKSISFNVVKVSILENLKYSVLVK